MWGLTELADSVQHAQDRGDHDEVTLAAAGERADLARAELTNEYPFLNAMTLVALYSALDALVEDLAPEVFNSASGSRDPSLCARPRSSIQRNGRSSRRNSKLRSKRRWSL